MFTWYPSRYIQVGFNLISVKVCVDVSFLWARTIALCLGCDVMHTWWANIQKLLNTYSAIGMEHYGVTVFIKVFFTVHFYTLGIFFQQDCSTKTAWAGDGSSSRYQSSDLCCTILSEDEQDLQNLFSCLLHAHKQTKMPPEGNEHLLNFVQFS